MRVIFFRRQPSIDVVLQHPQRHGAAALKDLVITFDPGAHRVRFVK